MTKDAIEIIHNTFYAGNLEEQQVLEQARSEDNIAQSLRRLRKEKGLTQRELAALVGTTPSVISRLEDADYDGHSLSMLRRIATSLGVKLTISFSAVTSKGTQSA